MPNKFSLRLVLLGSLLVLGFAFGNASITTAQSLSDTAKTGGTDAGEAKQGFQFADLVGKRVDIETTKGYFTDVEVTGVEPGKLDNSVKYFKLLNGKKNTKAVGSRVIEMHLDGKNLDVSYDKKNRSLIQDLDKRTERLAYEKATNARLRPQRRQLWKHLTVQQQEKFLKKQALFIEDVKKKLPDVNFRLVETEYFIFVTDLNIAEADGYIAYLDEMYAELCKAFGLPPEKNIWAGKCTVFAFRSQRTYVEFEQQVMKLNPTSVAGTQGICHQAGDGNVIFAGYKGTNNFFGHVLVHETSHGFVHRYLSSARAPSWLNEGMADWLADKVVQGKQIRQRQISSAKIVQQKGNWGNVLNVERINGDQYGICSVLVEILVDNDNGEGRFKKFIDGIKEGHSAQACLKEHFNMTYAELQGIYFQIISKW